MGMVGSQGLLSLSSGDAYLADTLAHGGDYLTLLDGLTAPYTERTQWRWSQDLPECSAGYDSQAVSESQMASLPRTTVRQNRRPPFGSAWPRISTDRLLEAQL